MNDLKQSRSTINAAPNLQIKNPGSGLILLLSLFAFFLILTPILGGWIAGGIEKPQAALRITMVIQDVMVFILPAIVMALAITRLPARLLAVDVKPNGRLLLLALLTLLFSVPVMNMIIQWNESIHLPESMASVEQTLRSLEQNAKQVTDMLMSGASVPSMLVSVLIVGVLAGFSEELFFRGAKQRLLVASKLNAHAAIWIVAFVFSLFHFQFFGFVPRMLLGAYFGYLLWWSKSLWVPMIVHMFNNSIVVCSTWLAANDSGSLLDTVGTGDSFGSVTIAVLSAICTVAGIVLLRRFAAAYPVSK